MKVINFRQFLKLFGFLLIVACTFTKVYGQTVEVVSQDTFSTENPPKEITVKLMEPLVFSESETYKAGSLLKGNLTNVTSPKRLKRDAGFSFEPVYCTDLDGKTAMIKTKLSAKYTEPVDKKELAKNVTLGVGSYFVKGLSMGVAAVSGAVKNEENNRLKSSADAVYEASPLSLVKKGEDLYIQKNDRFFLKFTTPEEEPEAKKTDSNVNKSKNYSYTTEKE